MVTCEASVAAGACVAAGGGEVGVAQALRAKEALSNRLSKTTSLRFMFLLLMVFFGLFWRRAEANPPHETQVFWPLSKVEAKTSYWLA
jgi:hypothetical protein